MSQPSPAPGARQTALTLLAGGAGAAAGFLLGFPVFVITGPALMLALLSLAGLRFGIAPPLWNAALLLIGLSTGARVSAEATAALMRWPLAFAVLAAMLAGIMLLGRAMLVRAFGFSRESAALATIPGHLSLVLGLATDLKADVQSISAVQTIRLMALTLAVPFLAKALGMDMSRALISPQTPMPPHQIALLAVAGLLLGMALRRLRLPAPMLLGGLMVSTLAHAAQWTPGPMSPWLSFPGFVVVGTMIGSRFGGVDPKRLARNGLAGLAATAIAMALAALAALPVAALLTMPYLHVLLAFAPGGLETMVAIGIVLGANPGFLIASHIARLFILVLLLPLALPRRAAEG